MTAVIEALEWNINRAGRGGRAVARRAANERFYPGRADDGWTHFRPRRPHFRRSNCIFININFNVLQEIFACLCSLFFGSNLRILIDSLNYVILYSSKKTNYEFSDAKI